MTIILENMPDRILRHQKVKEKAMQRILVKFKYLDKTNRTNSSRVKRNEEIFDLD